MRRPGPSSSTCTTKPNDVVDLTAGARYQNREVDYVHGRYLEDGVNPYGIGGVGAGTPAGNCCTSAASGTWLYYQDPGYAKIPYSTPQTNPNLLLTYNNFANGPIAVKNPDHRRHDRSCHLPQHGVEGRRDTEQLPRRSSRTPSIPTR